jgi:uncharacterized protein YjbI with pentapeptide repeats
MDTNEILEKYAAGERNFTRITLAEMNLSSANLSGIDLSGAILTGAKLSKTNLSGADLLCADLCWGFMPGVNLTRGKSSERDMSRHVTFESLAPKGLQP